MCTTGAKILQLGREFVLFKNRDFTRKHFDDRLSLSNQAFGALGLETWDGSDPDSDRFSGFSIGFNRHLACCDSNVQTVPGGDNYDRLVQAVVENCATIDKAADCVRDLARSRPFCWANMIVATADGVAALEVRDGRIEVDRQPTQVARANHHVCLGAHPDDDDTTTTSFRYQSAASRLDGVRDLADVFALLRSHAPDPQHSVCNHGQYDTVYSYVVHVLDGATTLYVHQGHPCAGDYVRLPITLGAANDLSAYPSSRAFTA